MTKGLSWYEYQQSNIKNVDYVLINSPDNRDFFKIYDFDSNENMLPQGPGIHYAQSSFDGGSMVLKWRGKKLISANIVLNETRHARILKSASMWLTPGDRLSKKFSTNLAKGIFDLAALKAVSIEEKVKAGEIDPPSRVYIRPAVLRVGKFGVAPTADDKLHVSCIMWEWGPYLPEDAYANGATALVFTNVTRSHPILGKHSANYAGFGPIGSFARKHGFHEAIIPGPYLYDYAEKIKTYITPQTNLTKMLDYLVLADGPGEDLIFVSSAGKVYKQPLDTNILMGTTRAYITDYLASEIGLEVEERVITTKDVLREDLVPIFVGNAVKACKVREISFTDGKVILDFKLKIKPNKFADSLAKRYQAELDGKVKPSDASLLTSVDLDLGYNLLKKHQISK